jgi:hypothetical protein
LLIDPGSKHFGMSLNGVTVVSVPNVLSQSTSL